MQPIESYERLSGLLLELAATTEQELAVLMGVLCEVADALGVDLTRPGAASELVARAHAVSAVRCAPEMAVWGGES